MYTYLKLYNSNSSLELLSQFAEFYKIRFTSEFTLQKFFEINRDSIFNQILSSDRNHWTYLLRYTALIPLNIHTLYHINMWSYICSTNTVLPPHYSFPPENTAFTYWGVNCGLLPSV